MPNHRTRDPLAAMMAHLREGREEGLGFDQAWARGWRQITSSRGWPHATVYRAVYKHALLAAREEMCAAYEGRETPLSRALRAIDEFGDQGDTARVLVLAAAA